MTKPVTPDANPRPMRKKLCADDPLQGEYSLCGNAFDAPDDPMGDVEAFDFARPGQTVNCDECLRAIAEIKLRYSPKGRYYK